VKLEATVPSRIFDFVERCVGTGDPAALINEFRAHALTFGFHHSACGCWFGVGANRTTRFFFVDWPDEVQEWYARENMFARDPLVFAARRRMTPFTFSEVFEGEPLLPEMREVYDLVLRFGYADGFAVPIHGPAGYRGLVSLLAPKKLNLTARDRVALEIMSRAIHDRCRATIGFGMITDDLPKLSAREIECMKWVAAGKTNWEVAKVLGISKSTVHFHVERVKKKLRKTSRTEVVATLLLHGFL
jgi:DNA-binding CsgD family transcriptional regulator